MIKGGGATLWGKRTNNTQYFISGSGDNFSRLHKKIQSSNFKEELHKQCS